MYSHAILGLEALYLLGLLLYIHLLVHPILLVIKHDEVSIGYVKAREPLTSHLSIKDVFIDNKRCSFCVLQGAPASPDPISTRTTSGALPFHSHSQTDLVDGPKLAEDVIQLLRLDLERKVLHKEDAINLLRQPWGVHSLPSNIK